MKIRTTAKPKLPSPTEPDPRVRGPLPPRWGEDGLTAFLDGYRGNQFATFVNKSDQVRDLVRIDAMYRKLLDGARGLKPMVPVQFAFRAHSAYLAAVGDVMAGQVYEAQAMMRLCLEHGAYGFYIGGNKDRWNIWQNRSNSAIAKKACKTEFLAIKVKDYLEVTAPVLAKHYAWLYDQLIDFGAHPNEAGFAMSSSIYRDGEDIHWSTIYLQSDGVPLDYGLKTVGRVGLWVLHIMKLLYPQRFEEQGLRAELEEIRARF